MLCIRYLGIKHHKAINTDTYSSSSSDLGDSKSNQDLYEKVQTLRKKKMRKISLADVDTQTSSNSLQSLIKEWIMASIQISSSQDDVVEKVRYFVFYWKHQSNVRWDNEKVRTHRVPSNTRTISRLFCFTFVSSNLLPIGYEVFIIYYQKIHE